MHRIELWQSVQAGCVEKKKELKRKEREKKEESSSEDGDAAEAKPSLRLPVKQESSSVEDSDYTDNSSGKTVSRVYTEFNINISLMK